MWGALLAVLLLSGLVSLCFVWNSYTGPRHSAALGSPFDCNGLSDLHQEVYDDIEVHVFRTVVEENKGGTFFEWGLGGSTNVAAPYFTHGASADHVRPWCDHLNSDPTVKCAVESKAYEIMCFTLSRIAGKYGFVAPADTKKYRPYILAIEDFAERRKLKRYDVVHVDGRFRVACALTAWKLMDESSVLLIHDYTNRPAYHIIEEVFERRPEYTQDLGLNNTGVYGLFHKKPLVDPRVVDDLLSNYFSVQD